MALAKNQKQTQDKVLKSSIWQFNKLKYNKRLENGKFTHKTVPGSKITKAHETNAKSQSKEFAAALELKTNNNFGEND